MQITYPITYFPSNWNILTFFFYQFSIFFVSFYIILCKLSSFMRMEKTSTKRCVYNLGNLYLFRFTSLYSLHNHTKLKGAVLSPEERDLRYCWRSFRLLWILKCSWSCIVSNPFINVLSICLVPFKFKFKFIYSHLFNYNTTTIRKKRSKNRANYTLN